MSIKTKTVQSKSLSRSSVKPAQPSADAGYLEVEYYYDNHPTKEDLMAEGVPQSELIHYLVSLLKWLYHEENWFVVTNLGIYQTANPTEYPIAPDVAVFKDVVVSKAASHGLRSWKMIRDNRPAPSVVFEISSKDTWLEDLNLKPLQYQQVGVKEYFAYDPNVPTLWMEKRKRTEVRLRGWSYEAGQMTELLSNEQGWLWSKELNSWLVPDTEMLRLYDSNKKLRLTQAEAEAAAKERAWAKLRELNIDPESL